MSIPLDTFAQGSRFVIVNVHYIITNNAWARV